MAQTSDIIAFLRKYHDDVMGREAAAKAALEAGSLEKYNACMKEKAEMMAAILDKAQPCLAKLPEETAKPITRKLHIFSASARNGLRLNSPFYWSALLWNDDAKPDDPDNLELFIRDLERDA